MLLAREHVITCRVRAFTLILEIRGGSQIIIPRMIFDRKQNQAMGKKVFLRADIHYYFVSIVSFFQAFWVLNIFKVSEGWLEYLGNEKCVQH